MIQTGKSFQLSWYNIICCKTGGEAVLDYSNKFFEVQKSSALKRLVILHKKKEKMGVGTQVVVGGGGGGGT
jgi:hypothetical protein